MSKTTALKACFKCGGPLGDFDDLLCKKCVKHNSVADDELIRAGKFKILHRARNLPAQWEFVGETNRSIGLIHGRPYWQEEAYRLASMNA